MTGYGHSDAYQTTSYGAQGGVDGGGFMEHGGSQGGSQDTGGSKRGDDGLRPVTIKQLLDASQPYPDAEFKIDGGFVNEVTFIGQIRSISTQQTNITYKVDDGTGIIEAKQWVDVEKAPAVKLGVEENSYVRIFGRIKGFNNKRFVGAHIVRAVTDANEISMHLLEATYVHLYFTRGPPEALPAGGGAGKANNDAMFVDQSYGQVGSNSAMSAGRLIAQQKPMAKKVLHVLQSAPQNNEGLNVQQIASALNVPVEDIISVGDELLHAGIIYTTIDDDTWAILEY